MSRSEVGCKSWSQRCLYGSTPKLRPFVLLVHVVLPDEWAPHSLNPDASITLPGPVLEPIHSLLVHWQPNLAAKQGCSLSTPPTSSKSAWLYGTSAYLLMRSPGAGFLGERSRIIPGRSSWKKSLSGEATATAMPSCGTSTGAQRGELHRSTRYNYMTAAITLQS
jgi:hypothetical protein